MKIEKKHWAIIGVVVAIILVWYFFLRKKKCCGWDANGKCTTKCDPKTGAAPTTSPSESGYDSRLDAALPMIGRESGYAGNESGYKKDPCASHTCPSGCTKISISNGRCGCKCYRQGQMGPVWA